MTKDIESGGKFCALPGFWGQLQKSPLTERNSHSPKHLKPAINCITLAVDDLKKSLAFYRDGLGLPAQFSAELEDGADCTAFELAGDLWLMPMPRAKFCQVHQDRLPARCTARFIGVHLELFRRQQRVRGRHPETR